LHLALALVFGLLPFTAVIPGFCANPPGRLPNVVVILTDDLGYGDIGVFGAKGYQTPRLDRMATEGRVFRNFHVAQAVCSASRAGLLTGCYPNRMGIHGALGPKSKTGLAAEEMTLADLLKQRGYASAIFGKWHLGDAPQFLPLRQGFDRYFGLPYSNDMWPHHPDLAKLPAGDQRRKAGYPELRLFDGDEVKIPEVTSAHQDQLTTWYTEKAVKFIEDNQNRPFFLYLAHNMPHVPLHVSDKFRGKTSRGLYGDVIEEIDWSVGQVLDALQRTGLEGDTWVIFTSDNGPWLSYGTHAGSAFPLREGKGTSWEGGTRVPCVMRWPGKIPAGTESSQMLMTIDLFPTIAKLVGADLPQHAIDGLDVWPIVKGQSGASNPHAAYWFYYEVNELQAVVSGDGRWKLALPHRYRTLNGKPGGIGGLPVAYEHRRLEKAELYDLVNDVSELRDVSARYPGMVAMLQAEAEKARAELGDGLTNRKGRGTRAPGRLAATGEK
jgi:arylsulfatase